MHLKPKRLLPVLVLVAAATAFAVPPSWWTEGDPPVIDAAAGPNNHGPANIGQAKHMAHSALSALRQAVPTIADEVEEDLVGPGKPIPNWDPPANEDEREKNHAPLLVGQLKAIAAPFYERIDAVAPLWLATQRADNGTETGGIFPWTEVPADDNNHAMASIGQLKAVFALDFTHDTDGDELADLAEHFFGSDSEIQDTDGDGLDDAEEYELETDPNSIDTDGDGKTDDEEVADGSEPADPDTDNDTLNDGVDADPLDDVINWTAGPHPAFAVIELDGEALADADQLVCDDLTENGTILLSRIVNQGITERIVINRNRVPISYQPGSSATGESYAGYGTQLIGEMVPGFRFVNQLSQESLWDPLANTYTDWGWLGVMSGYHDDIRDDRNGVTIWYGGHWLTYQWQNGLRISPDGDLLPGSAALEQSSASMEKDRNIVSNNYYWRWNTLEGTYDEPIPLPEVNSATSSATLRRPGTQLNQILKWNLAATSEGLAVAENDEAFVLATASISAEPLHGVTTQGWLFRTTSEGESRIWSNGRWSLLHELLGDPDITSAQVLRTLDTGHAVARIRRDNEPFVIALLLPVEVVAVSPKTKDEEGNDIDGSEMPSSGRPLTPFVEIEPTINRIAHRELKVRIGKPLEGKTVTWTLDAMPGVTPASIRGDWADSATHPDRFEASTAYGANGFSRLSQASGRTTVDSDGFTAIRVNVPPVGFNKVRIRVRLEGSDEPIDLIDMEVPGVVVIDPGHGVGEAGSSNAIGGSGVTTGVLEHDFALDIGTRMATEIRRRRESEYLGIKVFITRSGTANLSFPSRTEVARENGCDVYVSIHFNDVDGVPLRRHPFGMWDLTGNHNLEEDQALAIRLRRAVQRAITTVETEESRNAATDGITSENHEANLQKGLDTCSDSTNNTAPNYNGNVPGYTPCRAALIELEWMSNNRADLLFNDGNTPLSTSAISMREEAAQEMVDAVIEDLYIQPAQ